MTPRCAHSVPDKKNLRGVNDDSVKPYRSPEGRPRGSSEIGVRKPTHHPITKQAPPLKSDIAMGNSILFPWTVPCCDFLQPPPTWPGPGRDTPPRGGGGQGGHLGTAGIFFKLSRQSVSILRPEVQLSLKAGRLNPESGSQPSRRC